MTVQLWKIRKGVADLFTERDGVAMTEAIVVVPFLTLFAVGILEFGAVFWEREQIETGLRDAARYMARCNHPVATCEATARNLAYYGSSTPTAALRVPSWKEANSPINFTQATVGLQDIMTANTTHDLSHSPLFGFLGIADITIFAEHHQRVTGW